MKGHDDGNTWKVIKDLLSKEEYEVDQRILSPDQFGVPQHRKRIYIVGVKKESVDSEIKIKYPEVNAPEKINISDYLEKGPEENMPLKEETLKHLHHWQDFIQSVDRVGRRDIPGFPVWSMEFGATYPFLEKATSQYDLSSLNNTKGKFGIPIQQILKKN